MAPFMVVAHLKASSADARQLVIETLGTAQRYAQSLEPGVAKYAIAVPQPNNDDGSSVYIFEEYSDQTAYDAHITSPAVAEVTTLFTSSPGLMAAPGDIWRLDVRASFSHPEVDIREDAYFVLATLHYRQGTAAAAIDGFEKVCEHSKANEPGCLSYNVLRSSAASQEDEIRTLEVYESESYLWDVHAKSDVVKNNVAMQQDTRVRTDLVFLKKVKGYISR